MKPAIAAAVAVVVTVGMVQWMRDEPVTSQSTEASCADDAPPAPEPKQVPFIGICRN